MDLDTIKKAVTPVEAVVEVAVELPRFGWDNPKYDNLETPVREVMSAYQNANKWLDSIKEHILINLNCPYFSNIVHELAHTMPARFDEFGDILHTEGLGIPYPTTMEWENPIGNISESIKRIYEILDQIRVSLRVFKLAAESCDCLEMSIACDPLLTDIHAEYMFFHRAESMLNSFGGNLAQWDKFIYEFYQDKDKLI